MGDPLGSLVQGSKKQTILCVIWTYDFFAFLHPIRTQATYVKDRRNFAFCLSGIVGNSNFFLLQVEKI
jgi:hypothetical protein